MKKESGRSLVEMLGVLAIVAVILLASLFMFNSLFKHYQRRETVSAMHTLVTRFKTSALSKMTTVEVKKIMPEATTKGKKIVTANGGTLGLVANPETSTFVVIGNNLGLSCDDFITDGNYDAVAYGDSDIRTDKALAETTFTNIYSHDKAVEALRTICDGKYQYFLYGNASEGCKYFVNGKCSNCPSSNQVVGKDGLCCSPAELAAKCGYCGTTCGGHGKCVDGVCSECENDSDCKNNPAYQADKKFYCVNTVCKQCREIGKQCPGWDEGYICNSRRECVQCDSAFEFWNGFNCECKIDKPTLGGACSEKCGCAGDDLTCTNGVCMPEDCEGCEICEGFPKAKQEGRLCPKVKGSEIKTEADCTCCKEEKLDKNGYCVDCNKNTDGRTRFDNTNKECVCQPGYEYISGKCVADSKCELKCAQKGIKLSQGESCAGENSCCCDQGLECKNSTCQCPTTPKVPNATCNAACGCKAGTELGCVNNKCQCPSDKPVWDADQGKCVQCLTTDDCEGNTWCDTTTKVCKPCSTTPVPTCSISEEVKDAKGCVLKTPFTCPGEKDNAKNLICRNDTTCVECTNNLHCPENTFCNGNNKCQACGPDTTAPYVKSIRAKDDAGRCGCPTGYNIYCRSTSARGSSTCVEGNYICRAGCQQTSDCDPNEYCYKNPSTATLGECKPCPTGQYRNEGETECHACSGCEQYDEILKKCVPTCQNDEVCLMNSCTAAANQSGTCAVSPNPSTWSCVKKPNLIEIKGASTAGGRFYLPPADSKYLMYQPDAARFCESYGLRLANIQQACGKDWAYDSGYDCANISAHNLYQYGNRNSGTFWMDARYGAECTSLTITYSCGNNHESPVCSIQQYPLCTDGSSVKCSNNKECPENYYCTNDGCKPCGADGSAVRKTSDNSCKCSNGKKAYCFKHGKWQAGNCDNENLVCKAETTCYDNKECGTNKYCAKAEGKEFGQCSSCPDGQIRDEKDEACHGCKETKDCPTNSECKIEDGAETGACTPCQDGFKRDEHDDECKVDRFSDHWAK